MPFGRASGPPGSTTDPSMIQVRSERAADREQVFALQATAFGRSDEAELVGTLRATAHPQVSLVASLDEELVGHIFFSPVSIESSVPSPPCAALGPVGVLPARQSCGVGSALIRAGLDRCVELGWQAVFLVGDPAFYARFGFVLAAPRGLRYVSHAFDPAFQVVELRRGALQGCRGWVHFHEAFDEDDEAR